MKDPGVILLAEDNEDDIILLRHAFARAGFTNRIHTVSDGGQAIAYLAGTGVFADRASHPLPDVLLLDLMMPGKSGFEVLQWIRSSPHHRQLKVIILTDCRQPGDAKRACKLGANAVLLKSMDFRAEVDAICSLFDHWAARPAKLKAAA